MAVRPQSSIATVAIGWGSIGVIVRAVALPSVAIVASRVTIGAAGLGIYLLVRRAPAAPRLFDHFRRRTVATGILLALHWAALLAALQQAPIGLVLLITYFAPVLVAAAAPRVLGERVPLQVRVALAVAVVGCALLFGPGADGVAPGGLLLAGVACGSYALLTLIAKPLAEHYGGVRLAFQQQVVAAVALVPFAVLADWGPPRAAWTWLVVLGLVHTAAGTAVFLSALARLPATVVALIGYLEPASAVLFGWWFLAERPRLFTSIGGAMVLAAGVVALRSGSATVPPPEVAGAVR